MRDSYIPTMIEEGVWVVPAWRDPPEPDAALNLMLEPGLAFGTGEHPTTRLCVRRLRREVNAGGLMRVPTY